MMRKTTYKQKTLTLGTANADADLMIFVMGQFESLGDFHFAQHSKYHSVHVIESGEGFFIVDGKKHSVAANRIFTFFPGQFIDYGDFPEKPWKYTWFNFCGLKIESLLATVGITRENPCVDFSTSLIFKSVLAAVVEECLSRSENPILPYAAAWKILHSISLNKRTPVDERLKKTKIHETCKVLIDTHPDNNLTVDGLSDMLKVDRSNLYRLFKRHYKISPKEYIDQRRFNTAKKLLSESDMSIRDIVKACGFNKHHYFSRVFRERFGMTPTEYRFSQKHNEGMRQ